MTAVTGYRLGRMGVSGVILCGREHLNSLEESSMEEVKQAINSVDWLSAYFEMGEKYIRSRDGRIKYVFSGMRHNINAIKSKARILLAWIDEAEHVSESAWRTLIPTVREQDPQGRWRSEIWVTYNPESPESATHKRFRDSPPEDSKVVEMNWRDNPWFPEVMEQERQDDYRLRPDIYDHIWEGAFLTISDAQIFKDKYRIEAFDPGSDWAGPYHGLDFGFANDPTAATQSFIKTEPGYRGLFIRREMFRQKLELDDTAQAVAQAIPQSPFYVIRADNARPESISYLARNGLPRITAARKWKGSVEDGIEFLKSFDEIVIHPSCTELIREFNLYMYKVDRLTGDVLPQPVDAYNHGIDSLRYALDPLIKGKSGPRIRMI